MRIRRAATAIATMIVAIVVAIAVPVASLKTVTVVASCCCPDPAHCHCPDASKHGGNCPAIRACHRIQFEYVSPAATGVRSRPRSRSPSRPGSRVVTVFVASIAPRAAGSRAARRPRPSAGARHGDRFYPVTSFFLRGSSCATRLHCLISSLPAAAIRTPPDNDPFATFEDCYDEHHNEEHFNIQDAIEVCCIDHPIGSAAMNVVCGDTEADCETYVDANLTIDPAVTPDDITAACTAYVTDRNG